MDDINFDELDKAVASAAQSSTAVQAEEPVEAVGAPSNSVEPPVSSAPIATKRRGQFMDMVHPSSDMSKTPAVSSGVRRQAPAVQPLNPSIVETSSTPVPVDTSPATTASPSDYTWPDPIDTSTTLPDNEDLAATEEVTVETVENGFMSSVSPVTATEQVEAVVSSDDISTDTANNDEAAQPETQESPFVEGAEVEKRPLGAFASPASEEEVVPESLQTPVAEVEVSEQTESTETVGSTVEVETVPAIDRSAETVEVEQTEAVETVTEQPIGTIEAQSMPQPDEGTAQSIPQQYRAEEEVTTVDAEEHAVFDTESYHQPLPLPEKSRGGHKLLMYTLLAVLMLAIGAAAGYAIFVLKLL